ncbi:hypothetical protein GGR46_003444 [Sphingomonas kyeonggiensis]|uniref:Uncharacterized protein n=2 Tax=Sphingomonas kyeonggiensis TaxID=1268553 RepID=A0A7W6JWN3_9SPHN|nr:hypothetical protein [Sphingomonas kyeonggiensis]
MPPTRYRVVEQGRRLVVIDTLAGRSVAPPAVTARPEIFADRPRTMGAPRPQSQPRPMPRASEPRGRDSGGEGFSFTTAPWFDKQAPRRIRIGTDAQGQLIGGLMVAIVVLIFLFALIGWPIAFVLAFVVFNAKVRDGFRTAATTWLTALDATPN